MLSTDMQRNVLTQMGCNHNAINAYFQILNTGCPMKASAITRYLGYDPQSANYIVQMNKELTKREQLISNSQSILVSRANQLSGGSTADVKGVMRSFLKSKAFSDSEIDSYFYCCDYGANFNNRTQLQQKFNLDSRQADRILYIHKIASGRSQINTEQQMSTHLKKLDGGRRKITLADLEVSKVAEIPKLAIVNGIEQPNFAVFNSGKYWKARGNNKFYGVYKVLKNSAEHVTIASPVKPVIKYSATGKSRVVDGVLDIHGIRTDGTVEVELSSKYCKLCNRYAIIATLRKPDAHLGCFTLMCLEGTRVYVSAIKIPSTRTKVSLKGERVYAWGIIPEQLNSKLHSVATYLYKQLIGNPSQGTKMSYTKPTTGFSLVDMRSKINLEKDVSNIEDDQGGFDDE